MPAAMASMEEIDENARTDDMVAHRTACHRHLVGHAVTARYHAAESGDDDSEDLMICRIQTRQKSISMCYSFPGK